MRLSATNQQHLRGPKLFCCQHKKQLGSANVLRAFATAWLCRQWLRLERMVVSRLRRRRTTQNSTADGIGAHEEAPLHPVSDGRALSLRFPGRAEKSLSLRNPTQTHQSHCMLGLRFFYQPRQILPCRRTFFLCHLVWTATFRRATHSGYTSIGGDSWDTRRLLQN
jgi:hypothetical protein